MDLSILKNIGLTDAEIRIYNALVQLGEAPIFKIMKTAKVSSSKVYLLLEKLIQKGLVCTTIENKTKLFRITNPQSIIELVEKQKEELNQVNNKVESLIPQIKSKIGSLEQESTQIYTGVKGISAAFQNLLSELNKNDEYLFFSINPNELTSKEMDLFFSNYHLKRIEKGIKLRGIVHPQLKNSYLKKVLHRDFKIKHHKLTMPTGVIIGKNRILMPLWGDQNICYEIISNRMVNRYKEFFSKLWDEK
ncbi:MAG: TrmB family transcriptional regulator [Nanobdellota archaeon]